MTPHLVDLFLDNPAPVVFEAEVVEPRGELAAVREAVGQLHEYRWFVGPRDAMLCVLLNQEPGPALVAYVEANLGLLLAWWTGGDLAWRTETVQWLDDANVRLGPPQAQVSGAGCEVVTRRLEAARTNPIAGEGGRCQEQHGAVGVAR